MPTWLRLWVFPVAVLPFIWVFGDYMYATGLHTKIVVTITVVGACIVFSWPHGERY